MRVSREERPRAFVFLYTRPTLRSAESGFASVYTAARRGPPLDSAPSRRSAQICSPTVVQTVTCCSTQYQALIPAECLVGSSDSLEQASEFSTRERGGKGGCSTCSSCRIRDSLEQRRPTVSETVSHPGFHSLHPVTSVGDACAIPVIGDSRVQICMNAPFEAVFILFM